MGKKRPIGFITPGGYKKTKDGWIKVRRQKSSTKAGARFFIPDYYGKNKPKYFPSKTARDEFIVRMKEGVTGGQKGRKIASTARIKVGTSVTVRVGGRSYKGVVTDTHKSGAKPPYAFSVQYTDKQGQSTVQTVPRADVKRLVLKKEKEQIKVGQMREEAQTLSTREVTDEVRKQATDMVMASWDVFSKLVSKYYRKRIGGGFDASRFGFDEEDLKQETFITLQQAAESYISNPARRANASFKNYVMSFLKANLAGRLAVASGIGNHMKKNDKEQMYLHFYRDTIRQYRERYGHLPSDLEAVKLLENKRRALADVQGNKLVRAYEWTLDKVKNKRQMARTALSLERTVETGYGESTTLLELLSEEDLERIPGHLKMDPWIETQKNLVREGLERSIKRKFPNKTDQEILVRSYGLFVDKDDPQIKRQYVMGQTSGEIARRLNFDAGTEKWNSKLVEQRTADLLKKLRSDKQFVKEMEAFVKAEVGEFAEWSDVRLIAYWIACYKIMSEAAVQTFDKKLLEKKPRVGFIRE